MANSKIHRLPCRRWKLVDVKLSKDGNLEWTYRWKDSTSLPEITQWNDTIDREIALYDGYQEAAIIGVKIRMFKLVPGDQESRKYWNYKTNREERIEMEPYGLVDVADAKLKYEEYLRNSQEHLFDKLLGPGENLLRKTYDLAIMRRDSPQTSPEEQDLLDRTLRLWVAIRLTTNSFYFRDKNKAYNRSESDRKILLHPVFGMSFNRRWTLPHPWPNQVSRTQKAILTGENMQASRLTDCSSTTSCPSFGGKRWRSYSP